MGPCAAYIGEAGNYRPTAKKSGAPSYFVLLAVIADAADLAADVAVFGAGCCTTYLAAAEYANANLGGPTASRQARRPAPTPGR